MQKMKKIYIEITNDCNLNCTYCKKNNRRIEYISTENFENILRIIKEHTNYIYLHVLGEPLLHEQLGLLLELCEKYFIKASITTNSTLIDKQKNNLKNKEALRQINYSMHNIIENNLDYKLIVNNIIDLINETPSVYHNIRLWNLQSEDESINDYIINEFAKYYDFKFSLESINNGSFTIADNVFFQFAKRFIWPNVNNSNIFTKGRCGGLSHDCAILVNGDIVPCCLDGNGEMVLGNIYANKSLNNVLTSVRAKNILEGFKLSEVREDFCKTCGFAKNIYQNK